MNNQQNNQDLLVDPIFLQSEDQILKYYIDEELKKNNALPYAKFLEKKKLIVTLISAGINLILISIFRVFHYSFIYLFLLFLINFYFFRKYTKNTLFAVLTKEIKSRRDEDVSNIVASMCYDSCKSQDWLRWIIYLAFTFIIPIMLFANNHIFYEDAPDGKYVRFFTSGIIDLNKIEIPETIDGITVKGIRGDVFKNTSITKISLPNTIDTLRGHAFENCDYLIEINLPENLKYIGGYAFADCSSLKEIILPENLKYIGGYSFYNCTNLTINGLPQNLDSLGGYAFQNCSKIDNIVLPNKLTEIRGGTFAGTSIKNIIIPEGVIRIGGHAFEDCSELKNVEIPSTLQEIGSSAFRRCKNLSEISIPKNCDVNTRAFKESPTSINYY